jgi:hypothetical protein
LEWSFAALRCWRRFLRAVAIVENKRLVAALAHVAERQKQYDEQ